MKYHNITKDDMLNGEGLRVVLWVSGCTHHCDGCQNSITWNADNGLEFGVDEFLEIWEELSQDYINGITFTGGDPLHPYNKDYIFNLSKQIKEAFPNKTIWLYTGFDWEDIKDLNIMEYIDVLIDGKFVKNLKDNNLYWRGSSNQNVIDVQKSLLENKIVSYI